MQFNLYVLALIVTLYSAGPTYAAQKADCSSLLTEAQAAVLRATVESTNHYTIKVLSKDIAGKNRVVVILGEGSHTKGQQDSDLGKQILNQFSVYGIESASPAATWGGRLIAWPASWARQQGWFRQRGPRDFLATLNADGKLHVRIRNRRYDDPRIGQPRAAGRMFYGSGQFASTIQEAYLKGRSRKQLLLSDLRGVFEKYELSKLTKESADRLIIEIGEREIKGSSVEQAIVYL